jgi:hypothetical protein
VPSTQPAGRPDGAQLVDSRTMSKSLTADDILPLVACLAPQERVRLLRLIKVPLGADETVYRSLSPAHDEFSAEEDLLAWDAEGWEDVG